MNTRRYRDWYDSKLQTCDLIVASLGSASYPDAVILICCATSALAAQMWPGTGIDRRRFTEFLIEFAPDQAIVKRISVPVLVAKLTEFGQTHEASQLKQSFYPLHDTQVLTSDDVDQDEATIRRLLPAVSTRQIRESSIAGILYSDFRSALVHEYSLSPYLRSFNQSWREDIPSYVNMSIGPDDATVREFANTYGIDEPSAMSALSRSQRFLHLPYQFVRQLLFDVVQSAFRFWDAQPSWNRPAPSRWWIQG